MSKSGGGGGGGGGSCPGPPAPPPPPPFSYTTVYIYAGVCMHACTNPEINEKGVQYWGLGRRAAENFEIFMSFWCNLRLDARL